MGVRWDRWYNSGFIRFDGRCAFLDTNFLSIRQNIAPIARLPTNATYTLPHSKTLPSIDSSTNALNKLNILILI